jgi:hypothetical protein
MTNGYSADNGESAGRAPKHQDVVITSYPPADKTTNMAQVRTAIDDLDRQIVTLFGIPLPKSQSFQSLTAP